MFRAIECDHPERKQAFAQASCLPGLPAALRCCILMVWLDRAPERRESESAIGWPAAGGA